MHPNAKPTDRYLSFDGIDCNGNARRIMELIEQHQDSNDPFWLYFAAKRQPRSAPPPDDLFLVHCHLNQIRELFEERGDQQALDLLSEIEEECC